LIAVVDGLDSETSDDVQAALARFLAVRSCGHVEFTFDECLAQYAAAKAHPSVASYVREGLFTGRNPRPDALTQRLRRLNPEWADELDAYFGERDGERTRELSLLVDRRNGISHGQNEGLGVRKALDLAAVAVDIADWVMLRLDPTAQPT
jgi:hypothetical protein